MDLPNLKPSFPPNIQDGCNDIELLPPLSRIILTSALIDLQTNITLALSLMPVCFITSGSFPFTQTGIYSLLMGQNFLDSSETVHQDPHYVIVMLTYGPRQLHLNGSDGNQY